jgi:uncharacterized RDD family membrane protein YckC
LRQSVSVAAPARLAGLLRRLAALVYEALLLTAILLIAGFLVVGFTRGGAVGPWRLLHQAYYLAVAAGYFSWFWSHGRRTLAMKTWHLHLLTASGQALTPTRALWRFLLAALGLSAFGMGLLWAIFDPDRLFLHDRLAGTRLVADD